MVTEATLKERARAMAVAMSERLRWVYALPLEGAFDQVCAILDDEGIPRVEQAAEARVVRYASDELGVALVLLEHQALSLSLLEAEGEAVVPVMRRVLDATGFVPQSKLWGAALDVADTEAARKALLALAHMVVAWDEGWSDLFLLHLASPDAFLRHDAVLAVTLAAMVARDVGPALELLGEAHTRERFPKLAETMREAIALLEATAGAPVDLAVATRRGAGPDPDAGP